MKKICITLFIFLLSLLVPEMVYAQEYEELPSTYVQLTYDNHYFVQEDEITYEYIVIYYLYHHITEIDDSDYAYFFRYNQPFYHGSILRDTNSYRLDMILLDEDKAEFHFTFTIRKYLVDDTYSGDITILFVEHSKMFIKTIENLYEKGFNDGVKSVLNKPYSIILEWTVPFVTLIIIGGIYMGFKREWFKK